MPALTELVGGGDRALMHVAPDPAAPPLSTPRPNTGSTRFNVKLSDAALREMAERLFPPSDRKTDAPQREGLANVLSYYERTLTMIADGHPGCQCGFCDGCLARGTLAGPQPGDRWDEWERLKEINRERLRERPARSATVSQEAVQAALLILKAAG